MKKSFPVSDATISVRIHDVLGMPCSAIVGGVTVGLRLGCVFYCVKRGGVTKAAGLISPLYRPHLGKFVAKLYRHHVRAGKLQ